MKTITFYSYKGGVGRTLLLANIAKYLCRFGQKVFALDFDLEAPGLHYKLTSSERTGASAHPGVVEYVFSFLSNDTRPMSISEYVCEVERRDDVGGIIHLMRAGDVPLADYWKRLAKINWHEVFYSERSRGIPFFLELKAKIETEFSPDYLLIDSRTGITEIGGVATTVLPESIVCLLLNNPENLEGAREVLRSIRRTRRVREQVPLDIVPVVARIPVSDEASETLVLETVRAFLNQDAPDIEDTLSLDRIFVLHSERSLELKESVLIDSSTNTDSLLLRDYIRLIAQLVPHEVLAPHVLPLVHEAMAGAWDNAEKTEKDLIALCEHSSVPEPHQALIKFYFLTKADKPKILLTAYRYWRVTGREDDPVLMSAIRECFSTDLNEHPNRTVPPEFVEAVWRTDGPKDVSVGLKLAQAYIKLERPRNASEVLGAVVGLQNFGPSDVTECLQLARQTNNATVAWHLINSYRASLSTHPKFGSAFRQSWAKTIVKFGGKQDALDFLDQELPREEIDVPTLLDYYGVFIRAEDEDTRAKVLQMIRRLEPGLLARSLRLPSSTLPRLLKMIDDLGIEEDVQTRLRGAMPEVDAIEIWQRAKRMGSGGPLTRPKVTRRAIR